MPLTVESVLKPSNMKQQQWERPCRERPLVEAAALSLLHPSHSHSCIPDLASPPNGSKVSKADAVTWCRKLSRHRHRHRAPEGRSAEASGLRRGRFLANRRPKIGGANSKGWRHPGQWWSAAFIEKEQSHQVKGFTSSDPRQPGGPGWDDGQNEGSRSRPACL